MLTIEDFERLPSEAVEYRELVDGMLVDVSGNTPRHNLLRDRLGALMADWARTSGSGTVIAEQEFDFLGNAHGPDISFFGPAKEAVLDLDRRVQRFVPDVAVEIVSESDSFNAMLRKKERYLRAGVGEVWIISVQNREVLIYRGNAVEVVRDGGVLRSEVMEGFVVGLGRLLEKLT